MTLTFNEDLGAAAVLANTDFEVKYTPSGGTEADDVNLSGTPAISGRTVSLTLEAAVADTDTVTVFYTKPTGTVDKLVDKFGNVTRDLRHRQGGGSGPRDRPARFQHCGAGGGRQGADADLQRGVE